MRNGWLMGSMVGWSWLVADPAAAIVPVPEPSPEALAYYRSGIVLWWIARLLALAIPIAWLYTGGAARLGALCGRIGSRWPIALALFFCAYQCIDWLLDLPLSAYAGFIRQHDYGLSTQSFGKWFGNSLKSLAIDCAIGAALLWLPWLALRKSPRRWWLWWTAGVAPVAIVAIWLQPLVISPLFNDFGPMKDKALEARILALAERAGIEGSRVFEVDKSVDTRRVNAYVTGFGSSKRIVLWDTLLDELNEDEVLFVMGHEMGHYVLDHIRRGVAESVLGALIGFALLRLLALSLLRRFGGRWEIRRLSEPAALPLLIAVGTALVFVTMPVPLALSRDVEHEADRFALELLRDNDACARSFVKLQHRNLSHPRPGAWYRWWRASHPPLGDRIDFCNTYRPWERGEPLRYGDRFAEPS